MPRPKDVIRPELLRTYGRGRAVRQPDFDYASDAVIHVTMCADHGLPFMDPASARPVCESVEVCSKLRHYRLYGYCLMPDHLHVLLSPADSKKPLGDWLRDFKSFTTNEFRRRTNARWLWQDSANDHVCCDGETAESVLAYVVDNPVRAGLVAHWRDWPWTKVFIEI